jgi:hypothetical protein
VDPDGYKGALGTTGLFAVRTLNSVEPAVSRGTLVYGAEPDPSPDAPATPKGWGASAGGLASLLLYGAPRDFLSFTSETGAAANGFELRTLPGGLTFSPAILGGTCGPVTSGSLARLLHKHNSQTAILQKELLSFCTTIITRNDQGSGVLAFARRMGEWLSPRPLHAATTMLLAGGMGGSLGGLSPIGPVVVDGSTVTLTFTQQPTTASINRDFNPAIKVYAATASGIALGGVQITLTVLGNNGTPITLKGYVATTANDGVALFDHFQTDKAGGYLFEARGTIAGAVTKADTSAMVNVNGQSP